MQILTRKGFFTQRLLLELELKEVLVRLFEGYYTESYDVLTEGEIMGNLRDLRLVHEFVGEGGEFEINEGVLKVNMELEFCELLSQYLDVMKKIKLYDEEFKKSFINPRKKRLNVTDGFKLPLRSEIKYLYGSSYLVGDAEVVKALECTGLIGEYVVSSNLSDFEGCPVWELGFERWIVPVRSVIGAKIRKSNKLVSLIEASGIGIVGVLNTVSLLKSKGLAKGILREPLDVNKYWEVINQ